MILKPNTTQTTGTCLFGENLNILWWKTLKTFNTHCCNVVGNVRWEKHRYLVLLSGNKIRQI